MRYPFLRDDPSDPVDIEVVDAGVQLVGPSGAKTIKWRSIKRVRLYCELSGANRSAGSEPFGRIRAIRILLHHHDPQKEYRADEHTARGGLGTR